MSEKLPLAIVGCGGMGHRHLYGLAELQEAGLSPFELVGACDPNLDNANSLADQAGELLGARPRPVGDLAGLASAAPVQAVDITTLPAHHHTVAIEAMERGWHAMCEKPMGLTVRACKQMIAKAEESGCILSVAENYRRDPVNRLARALLEAEVIGAPRLMQQVALSGDDRMVISDWRHQKNSSGILLDAGVHYADIMEYFLGEADTAYAQTRLHEPVRRNPVAGRPGVSSGSPGGVYERWQKDMPAEFSATADDAAYATILFKSGAVAQYIEDHAAHGQSQRRRSIHGSLGSLELPGDRSGNRLTLHLDGADPVDGEALLDLVPDYRLDEATAALFGGDRLFEYPFPFSETDRKLIAVEYHELGACIQQGRQPEVDARQGARSVALSYSLMESQAAGRALSVDAVRDDRINAYQAEINEHLGL
ncbi:MAG: Gfo/Idh/MocA family oxidoreductase [Gemmatimonadetes bacterium]|nr:Gfo/Idh/MocA family oxidoreductase [Gemmatimonadota bacterium]